MSSSSNQPVFQRSHTPRHEDPEIDFSRAMGPSKFQLAKKISWLLLVVSVLMALLNYGLTFIIPGAFGELSQHLYTGFMLTKGQLPYLDSFATGGLFYYAVLGLAYHLGGLIWFLPFQALLYYVSAYFLDKLLVALSAKTTYRIFGLIIFYFSLFAFGLGGPYPTLFALPFVLYSLWFMWQQYHSPKPDEQFIWYGFLSGLAIFMDPRSLIFYMLATLIWLSKKWKEKEMRRGFYQVLSQLFGFLIVFYFVGYFAFNLQLLSPYFTQGVVYSLLGWSWGTENIFASFFIQLLLLMASGMVTGLVFLPKLLKLETLKTEFVLTLSSSLIIYSIYVLFSRQFMLVGWLLLLPFGLLLLVLALNEQDRQIGRRNHTLKAFVSDDYGKRAWKLFLNLHFWLPLLVVVYALGINSYQIGNQASLQVQRNILSKEIADGTTVAESIYSWDTSTSIYQKSDRRSVSSFVLPYLYTGQKTHATTLIDDLLSDTASYVVVNKSLKLSEAVQKNLMDDYQEVSLDGISSFTLYQKK